MLVNTWYGAGRLGRDPEMSYTPNGKAYTRFSMAVDQGKGQPAMWLNVISWEKLAERINEQFKKGNEVFVQGRLTMRTYTDRNNVERQTFEVIASSAQLTQRPQTSTDSSSYPDPLGELEEHPF